METHNTKHVYPYLKIPDSSQLCLWPCKEKTKRTKIREPLRQKKDHRNQGYISD